VAQSRRECPFVARSAECVQSPFLDFSTARIALKKSLLAAKCNTKTPRKVFSRLCGAGATINEWREAGAWPRLLRLCLKRGCRLGPLPRQIEIDLAPSRIDCQLGHLSALLGVLLICLLQFR
jgi:hypothetical protein